MTAIDYTQRPSLTYQELLDTDSHEVPDVLRWFSPMPPSEADVPVERYTSAEFHQLEVDKVWTKVWQMACRDEDIPEVGDHLSYDIVGRSILVVRTAPEEIKAFHNVCPHRGRRLKESRGRDTELRSRVPRVRGGARRLPEAGALPVGLPSTRARRVVVARGARRYVGRLRVHQHGPRLRHARIASRRPDPPLRTLAARGPLQGGPRRQGDGLQLEGGAGGLHGGLPRRGDPPPAAAEPRRRHLAVRRLRQLQSGDHPQRCSQSARELGADTTGHLRRDERSQPRRGTQADRARG